MYVLKTNFSFAELPESYLVNNQIRFRLEFYNDQLSSFHIQQL